jgi:hypothetical protein
MTVAAVQHHWRPLAGLLLLVLALAPVVVLATRPTTATGVVTSIDQPSLTDLRSFTLRTTDGQTLTFSVGTLETGGNAFAPGHLTVHLVTAQPVLVTYHRAGDRLVATRLEDAPP